MVILEILLIRFTFILCYFFFFQSFFAFLFLFEIFDHGKVVVRRFSERRLQLVMIEKKKRKGK